MSFDSLLMAGKFGGLTAYCSVDFLIFFLPLVLLLYSIVGPKQKKYVLLVVSYIFFWLISGGLLFYLILSTVVSFGTGLWLDKLFADEKASLDRIEKEQKKAVKASYLRRKRLVLGLAALIHIGILLVLKYSGFFMENVNSLLAICKSPIQFDVPSFVMPIGISFYTMQAVSYVFDVYRGTIKADRNIFRLALFMSFFPQIVEGPICRYGQTADALWNVSKIEHKNLVLGSQRILYGFMKKVVIADRLNPLIEKVFTNFLDYDGGIVALAGICYTIQLYMEFSGTMDAVIGTAQIFGVTLPENFQRPFFSKTISEFWMRWHITLGAWFKDYIFYPVTLSKPIKKLTNSLKKKVGAHFALVVASAIALFCVWFSNGLWHGAAWNYIFFGMYHFTLITIGNIIEPAVKQMKKVLHINANWWWYRALQILRTSILVVIGEIFFRGHGLKSGLIMVKQLLTNFTLKNLTISTLNTMDLDIYDVRITAVAVLLVFVISVLKERGFKLRETLAKQNIVIRWATIYALLLFIIIFGAYGYGYLPVDPIYANF